MFLVRAARPRPLHPILPASANGHAVIPANGQSISTLMSIVYGVKSVRVRKKMLFLTNVFNKYANSKGTGGFSSLSNRSGDLDNKLFNHPKEAKN